MSIEDKNSYPELEGVQDPDIAPNKPDPNWIKSYSRYFRRMDSVVMMSFSNMKIIDDSNNSFKVPIILSTYEKIVYAIFGETSTQTSDNSGQFIKVRLPIIGLIPGTADIDLERYVYHEARNWERYVSNFSKDTLMLGQSIGIPIKRTYVLSILTRYYEDHQQIIEQVIQRFSPSIELRISDNFFPSTMTYDGSSNNFSEQTQPENLKLYRTEINISVNGWLPQPLKKEKAVLGVRFEIGQGDPVGLQQFQKTARFLVRDRTIDN
jgi:hypothetical protein